MANRLQKLLYFLSAESPVFIFAAVVIYVQRNEWLVPAILIILAVMATILFMVSFNYGRKSIPRLPVKAFEITNDEGPLIAYAISYLLPFGSLVIEEYYLPILIAVIIILELLLMFTDYVSPHPLLFFCGYHFYKVGVEGAAKDYYLVSRKTLRKPEDVAAVQRVFEFLLIREK